ncbi:MAG TPA: restriction endonuclease [Chloroflexota bacterium]|nr:restriction endonuclease [Chloroflexota bacterium]
MRHLTLIEHQTTPGVRLSREERETLRRVAPSIVVTPAAGGSTGYDLTPGSWIGAIATPGLAITIQPKLPVRQVLFLLSYAADPRHWQDTPFEFEAQTPLLEAMVPAFVKLVRRATRRGVLHGYRTVEQALPAVRGRLRFETQMSRRLGFWPPVEVRHDEFTADVIENRLLKGALERLGQLRWRSAAVAGSLRALLPALATVTPLASHDGTGRHGGEPPPVRYTRLNAHYRPAVELARLILRSSSLTLRAGRVAASTFLVDMNQVFEDFVVVALREALGLTPSAFPQGAAGKSMSLDRHGAVHLKPDLSWWEGDRCTFVGDVKYKRTRAPGVEHPDLYQLLAYTVATGLPGGLLIYAAGEGEPVSHQIVQEGKELQITALDLGHPPEAILDQIATMAQRVRRLRRRALAQPLQEARSE